MKNSEISLWDLRKILLEYRFPDADSNTINSLLNRGIPMVEKNYMLTHYLPEAVTKIPVKALSKKASFTSF